MWDAWQNAERDIAAARQERARLALQALAAAFAASGHALAWLGRLPAALAAGLRRVPAHR